MVKRSEENEIMKLLYRGESTDGVSGAIMQVVTDNWQQTLMRLTGDRGDGRRRALPGGAVA